MKKISLVVVIVGVFIILIAWLVFPRTQQPEQTIFSYDFENGLGDWAIGAQVPKDPLTGEPVAWKIEPTTDESVSGNFSIQLYIDGVQDDGTIWIERKLSLQANFARRVNVSFQFWSGSDSFNTIAEVVCYVGEKSPKEEADFQVLGTANQVSGWKTYSFSSLAKTGNKGEIYIALGISVRWEAEMTYFVDDVTLNLI